MMTSIERWVGDDPFGEPFVSTAVLKETTSTNESSAAQESGVSQIVSFRLSNEEYGIDIMHVQEIILIGQMTEMPQVPDDISGLINLRGHVIPIINLRRRFRLEQKPPSEHSRIIVLNVLKKTVGITVDSVSEVLRINPSQIEAAPPGLSNQAQQHLTGLVKFKDRILLLLDIEVLISDAHAGSSVSSSTG